jgi:peptide/nickel transport system permease protein
MYCYAAYSLNRREMGERVMTRYIIKRLLLVIPVLIGVLIVVFTITYFTPGDPVISKLGSDYTQEQYDTMQVQMGLDKGYFGQIGTYIWNLVTRFDMGKSYSNNIPIKTEIMARLPITFRIGASGLAISILLGIPLGILSSCKQYSITDVSLTALALFLAAIPGFVLALLALLLFGVKLRWLPISGLDSYKAWILPIVSSALGGIASMMRMTRTTMLEVIRQDYIRTARAKGLKERVVLFRHALGNCLIPLVTVIGGVTAMTLSGSVIVETIYTIPGMGLYMMSALSSRDYPVINGVVLMLAFVTCAVNLLVDILYAFIDPRIKAQYSSVLKVKTLKELTAVSERGA